MSEGRPLSERPAAKPAVPADASGSAPVAPAKRGLGCFGIGCLGVIGIAVVIGIVSIVGGQMSKSPGGGNGGSGTSSNTADPIEQARVVLGGAYTYEQVKQTTDAALTATSTVVSDENRSRAWSSVLSVTKELNAAPMDVMLCVTAYGPVANMTFPDAAALCATEIHLG